MIDETQAATDWVELRRIAKQRLGLWFKVSSGMAVGTLALLKWGAEFLDTLRQFWTALHAFLG